MDTEPTLCWCVEVFDKQSERHCCDLDFVDFDIDEARTLWDLYGPLRLHEAPDWWMVYCYVVEPRHLPFLRRFTSHVFDFEAHIYYVRSYLTPEVPGWRTPIPPMLAYSRMKFDGAPGRLIPNPDGGRDCIRWEFSDGRFLILEPNEWRLDLYTPEGQHLGEFDAVKGELIGPPDPSRRVAP